MSDTQREEHNPRIELTKTGEATYQLAIDGRDYGAAVNAVSVGWTAGENRAEVTVTFVTENFTYVRADAPTS